MNRPIFIPQVGPGVGVQTGKSGGIERTKKPGELSEFDQALGESSLKFSAHATQRLQERKIQLDPVLMQKVKLAVDKAEAKGVEDTLVLTKDAALIINVPNRTVITAMDKRNLDGNVFTNIDGAIIIQD